MEGRIDPVSVDAGRIQAQATLNVVVQPRTVNSSNISIIEYAAETLELLLVMNICSENFGPYV